MLTVTKSGQNNKRLAESNEVPCCTLVHTRLVTTAASDDDHKAQGTDDDDDDYTTQLVLGVGVLDSLLLCSALRVPGWL